MLARMVMAVFFCLICAKANSSPFNHVVCVPEIPKIADLALSITSSDVEPLAETLFERLARIDRHGKIQPSLAQSWQILENGLLYRFQLRPDVQFHAQPGFQPTRTLDARDVIFSFNRLLDQQALFAQIGGKSATPAMFPRNNIYSVKGEGLVVEVLLKQPNFNLIEELSAQDASIVSLEYALFLQARNTPQRFVDFPVGTGPFKFDKREDDSFSLVRFENHWNGRVAIDSLEFLAVPNELDRLIMVRKAECHQAIELSSRILAQSKSMANVNIYRAPILSVLFLAVDTRQWPWNDRRAREALSLAIDRQRILRLLFLSKSGSYATHLLHPQFLGLHRNGEQARDVDRAKKLISSVSDGKQIALKISTFDIARPHNPNPRRMAQLVKQDLESIGIQVDIEWVPIENIMAHVADVDNPQYQSLLMGYSADVPTPASMVNTLLGCVGSKPEPMNFSRMCDSQIASLLSSANTEVLAEKRLTLYRAAAKASRDKMQYINLLHADHVDLVRENIVGIVRTANGWMNFNEAKLMTVH